MNDFNENFLYHIWDQQHLKSELTLESGKTIKVLFSGHWNRGAGADFKNAILEIDGVNIQGDVEIHINTYDWNAHNHQDDANFNQVVLHVVYENKTSQQYTIKENGDLSEILKINDKLSEEIQKFLETENNLHFTEHEKYCPVFSIQNEWIPRLLTEYGMERFYRKIKRFKAELSFSSFDQLLYQGIFESLGYTNNKFPFYQLATQVPYVKIRQMIAEGYQKMDILSLWLHTSDLINLLPSGVKTVFSNDLNESFITHKYDVSDMNFDWNLFRIRPVNHPVLRLVQVLDFIYDSVDIGLTRHILKLFSFEKDKLSVISFRRRAQLFLSKQSLKDFDTRLGSSRIDMILINIIIPIIYIYSQKMEYEDLASYCIFLYKEFPGLSENTISNTMKKYLTEDIEQFIHTKAVNQQGLIQIYQTYCVNHLCDSCKNHLEAIKIKVNEE